ncbi:hypothetical protein K7432_012897 [Basidiobolus ranarum]|uniref:Uncharacterized protein n=1 Tax=Basidiobolus ranarum TaxID=34480 RepID=A0ABR2VRJ2_9FUNG
MTLKRQFPVIIDTNTIINTNTIPELNSESTSPTSSKSVRFSRFEQVYLTHSPEEYDRSPVRSPAIENSEVFMFPPPPSPNLVK